jgi:hypothetical protein
MRFYLAGEVYEAEDAKLRRVEDVVRRVEALPGVRAAFASNLVPLSNGGGGTVVIDGRPTQPNALAGIAFIGVTPHFNSTLGIVTTRGRDFTDAEGWSRTSGWRIAKSASILGCRDLARIVACAIWPPFFCIC